jgi:hypothetical protein
MWMARWTVYIEYGGESLEVDVNWDELETEEEVYQDVMANVQVWAEMVEDE